MKTSPKTEKELWEIAKRRHLAKQAASRADLSAPEKTLRPEEQENPDAMLVKDNC